MFFFLPFLGRQLNHELMYTIGEIVFRKLDSDYKTKLTRIFMESGEDEDLIKHPMKITTWMLDVKNPPYNMKSFEHWHFAHRPYLIPQSRDYPRHENVDDLPSTVNHTIKHLAELTSPRPWPISMLLKIVFGLIPDLYTPLHTSELFSDDFPNGDNNGKLFNINVKFSNINEKTTLFDYIESGCNLSSKSEIYSDEFYQSVSKIADQVLLTHGFDSAAAFGANSSFVVADETYQYTVKTYYNKLKNNYKTDQRFQDACQDHTREIISKSAQSIYYVVNTYFKNYEIPQKGPFALFGKAEVAAWSIFLVLLPATCLIIYKIHFPKKN